MLNIPSLSCKTQHSRVATEHEDCIQHFGRPRAGQGGLPATRANSFVKANKHTSDMPSHVCCLFVWKPVAAACRCSKLQAYTSSFPQSIISQRFLTCSTFQNMCCNLTPILRDPCPPKTTIPRKYALRGSGILSHDSQCSSNSA